MSGEAFTVMAILEARDRASEVFAKVDESLDKFSQTATRAAEAARGAASIDESLLQTASGADALDLASARVDAAQARAGSAAKAQADAERELIDAQRGATEAADGDTAAQDRLMEASRALTAAQKESALAAKGLSDAQKLQADTAKAAAAESDVAAATTSRWGSAGKTVASGLASVAKYAGITAAGLGIAGGLMVRAAGNFQDSTTHLVTDAGESSKNLAMVQAGILNVSTATATSAKSITDAMYHIESGGYHGAAGLNLLKVAAEGARVGGADLNTVAFALVGAMNAYKGSGYSATQMMNALIATVGAGDLKMQDLASALHSVAPIAAAAHMSFAQVGGAIATMTAQGMTAQQATQDLGHTIGSLSNPTNVMTNEMNALGVNSQDVSQHLGQRGLTGTIALLTKAITDHMGKSGQVIMSAFTQSTTAAQGLQTMLGTMPPQFKSMAEGLMNGTVSAKQWRSELQAQTPVNAHLLTQFATLYEKTHSFSAALASNGTASQTYQAALAKMMGGQMGLNVALMLSGQHMGDFKKSVGAVGAALSSHAKDVANWPLIQSTFSFKVAQAKTGLENTGIAIGTALLPAATSLMQVITRIVVPIAEWTSQHRTLTAVMFGGVAAIAATIAILAGVVKAYKAVTGAIGTVKKVVSTIGKLFRQQAVEQAAAAQEGATASEEAATESAAAQEEAAAGSSGSWLASFASTTAGAITSAARTVAAWAATAAGMVAQAAIWVASNTAKVAIVVAENVGGALATAAAWMIANAAMLLGIGLIVVAIAAAVYLIVTHWKQISEFCKKVFDDVLHIVESVINWVKGHWPLLLAILTGPIGLAVLFIVDHYHQILAAVSDAIGWVRSHWPLLLAILTGPIGLAVLFVVKHFAQIKDGAAHLIGDLVGFFGRLPGQILSAVGDLGKLLWNAGLSVINGLISGIEAAVPGLHSALSWVSSLIPSWKGPLDKDGRMLVPHGAAIMGGLMKGIASQLPALRSQLAGVTSGIPSAMSAGRASLSATGPALAALSTGAGSGEVHLHVEINNPHIMNDNDIKQLLNKMGPPLVQMLAQAGRRARA